mmetsp:Transcript_33093/g.76261  ORF Transcript_33093/g.76261 Transcript_33093/m.76261 type:complete len:213 (-) Transcript_33093:899-1537(-)
MLRSQLSRFEPHHIFWIIEHVPDGSMSLVDPRGKSREHGSFQHYPIGIGSRHVPRRHELTGRLSVRVHVLAIHQNPTRSVRQRSVGSHGHETGRVPSAAAGLVANFEKPLELVLVLSEPGLREHGPGPPGPVSGHEGQRVLGFDGGEVRRGVVVRDHVHVQVNHAELVLVRQQRQGQQEASGSARGGEGGVGRRGDVGEDQRDVGAGGDAAA